MHYSPNNRYNSSNSAPNNNASSEWDSLQEVAFNQINPSKDELDLVMPSKRQQDKLIKALVTNNPNVFTQPTADVYPGERQYVTDALADDSFIQNHLRHTINKIRPPYQTKNNEEIFAPISNDEHMSHILADSTGIGFNNYQNIGPSQINDFLRIYPSPIDFDNASANFLKRIGLQNSQQEYQEYLGAMHEFKHYIYGKRQEYWDQAKLLRQSKAETGLSLSPEIILQNSIIDGSPYSIYDQEYTLTPDILKQAGLEPSHEINVENRNIFLSDVFKVGNRNAAMAYVQDDDGNFRIRSYYQSNSSGAWRYLPDYVADKESGYPSWFGKAHGEDCITLPHQLQVKLNDISQNNILEIRNINPSLAFFGTAKKYPSKFVYDWLERQNQLTGDFYQEVSKQSKYDFGKLSIDKNPPESLNISPSFAPNFQNLTSSSHFDSPLCTGVTSELYSSYNDELLYNICSIQKGDHTEAWINNIETPSPITSTGCRAEWVSTGDYGTPLYEYKQQSDGYGDSYDFKGSYIGMWKHYLSKIPVIRRYLYETGKS